jgi:8-oxo-dGTP pyrophosphatase MutT (NUDIX family)
LDIVTVGTYIRIEGRYLFAFGPHSERPGRLAIVRVGGHREDGETAWECAVREAMEETGLTIAPVAVHQTLLGRRADGALEREFQEAGGQALMREVFPGEWVLEPALQLQLLARLLEIGDPDLTPKE